MQRKEGKVGSLRGAAASLTPKKKKTPPPQNARIGGPPACRDLNSLLLVLNSAAFPDGRSIIPSARPDEMRDGDPGHP